MLLLQQYFSADDIAQRLATILADEGCAAVPDAEYQARAALAPLPGYGREHLGWLGAPTIA